MPIGSEDTRLGRINVRDLNKENTPRLQPFRHFLQHLSRRKKMFEHIKARNYVERLRWEWSIKDISNKYLRAAPSFGCLCTLRGHLDAIQLPGFATHRLQEGPRATTQVEQNARPLLLCQVYLSPLPALNGVIPCT